MGSASEFGRDHGLIHEVVVAGRKAGWGKKEWAKLAHDENLMGLFREVLIGRMEVVMKTHIIDLDAPPYNPWSESGMKVVPVSVRAKGKLIWDMSRVKFFSRPTPARPSHGFTGHNIRDMLSESLVLSVHVLDHLLAHQFLIPDEWRGKSIFFWGTLYEDPKGVLYVRYLYWNGDTWDWGSLDLGYVWDSRDVAALWAA